MFRAKLPPEVVGSPSRFKMRHSKKVFVFKWLVECMLSVFYLFLNIPIQLEAQKYAKLNFFSDIAYFFKGK